MSDTTLSQEARDALRHILTRRNVSDELAGVQLGAIHLALDLERIEQQTQQVANFDFFNQEGNQ